MTKLKNINLLSFGKFQALLFTLLGLLAGILYAFGGFAIDALVSAGWVSSEIAQTPGISYGTLLAFGALIGMPVIFAACGFVAGIVEAASI